MKKLLAGAISLLLMSRLSNLRREFCGFFYYLSLVFTDFIGSAICYLSKYFKNGESNGRSGRV